MSTTIMVDTSTDALAELIVDTVRKYQLRHHTFEPGALATMLSRSEKCDEGYVAIKNKIHELVAAGLLTYQGYWGMLGIPEIS